jgi:hypothetical protein
VALDVAATVVESVDAESRELRRERVDLAQEVLGGEAALAESVRRRVGCRGHARAARGELPEKTRHDPGVSRVVELELVDAEQRRALEHARGTRVPERPDEGGVLDEGAEVLAAGRRVPEGREEVGLADAETAVEVEAGQHVLVAPAGEQPTRAPRGDERLHGGDGVRLRRVVEVGAVALDRGRGELAGRHEVVDHLLAREGRHPVGEVLVVTGRVAAHGRLAVSESYSDRAPRAPIAYGRCGGLGSPA